MYFLQSLSTGNYRILEVSLGLFHVNEGNDRRSGGANEGK